MILELTSSGLKAVDTDNRLVGNYVLGFDNIDRDDNHESSVEMWWWDSDPADCSCVTISHRYEWGDIYTVRFQQPMTDPETALCRLCRDNGARWLFDDHTDVEIRSLEALNKVLEEYIRRLTKWMI